MASSTTSNSEEATGDQPLSKRPRLEPWDEHFVKITPEMKGMNCG